ncbi:PHO80 (YOL001W) [Zygosaccharomyces parabailii]|nr:PHO80 (YOL001W) [Zygosaccharomyces parabailii]
MHGEDRKAPSVFEASRSDVTNVGTNVQGPPAPETRTDDISEIPTVQLPNHFSECSRTDLVILISRMLTFLIQMNDSTSSSALDSVTNLTKFHSKVPPGISVYNYLMRLTKYSSLEHCVLMSAVYYIDLLSSVYPTFTLNSLTVHRFLLTATTVASKGLCDSFCTNAHYAKVGGVHCSELNVLEGELLRRINYRILPRHDNIAWCKLENQQRQFVVDTKDDEDIPPHLSNLSSNRNNSGYNVLETYYNKIVQLVGFSKSTQDKSKLVNYTFAHHQSPNNIHINERFPTSTLRDQENKAIDSNDHNNNDNDNDTNAGCGEDLVERPMPSRKRNLDTDVLRIENKDKGTAGGKTAFHDGDHGTSGNINKRHFNRQKQQASDISQNNI